MSIRENIKRLTSIVKNSPTKTMLASGLIGLASTTILKDNVHFVGGSLTINNPIRNHYVWGFLPSVHIVGEGEGNIRTFGFIGSVNSLTENSNFVGNMSSYGLMVGDNILRDNSNFIGNMSSYGLIAGGNFLKDNSSIVGDSKSIGFFSSSPSRIGIVTCSEYNLNYTRDTNNIEDKDK